MLRFLPKRKNKAELKKSGRSGVKTKPGAHKLTGRDQLMLGRAQI